MSEDSRWIGSEAFAEVAQITPQAARKALKRRQWRGRPLGVRQAFGRGGRSGSAYELSLDSLSLAFPDLIVAPPHQPAPARARFTPATSDIVRRRWEAIAPALELEVGSRERSQAISSAATKLGVSRRSLYRWLARYARHGIGGLARARPSNAGQPRTCVSRAFDRAIRKAGVEEDLDGIRCDVEGDLKGLWASRAEAAGWREVGRMAEFLLRESCTRRNLKIDAAACRLPRRTVERFSSHRMLNRRRNDRKAFDDGKPRIRRDWTQLDPMEVIVADVKHLDLIVRRENGTQAWPKIVAFVDTGTGRIFAHPVLLQPGEGIRQEHVIEGFLAMATDPDWGFPRGLYLDNGSEFQALLKLETILGRMNDRGSRTIIFAQPYNAAAKPIESVFARLDRYVISMLPGYAGPNRLSKKTQTVGKPPSPFDGSWDQFCVALQALIADFNRRPVGGLWANRSPASWLDEKLAAGWRPSIANPAALDAAFCVQASRRVDRGGLKIAGQRYTHPYLYEVAAGVALDIALPWRRDALPMAQVPAHGWVRLALDPTFPARWIAGAREARRRQRAHRQHFDEMEQGITVADPVAVKMRMAAEYTGANSLPGIGATLDLGSHEELGVAVSAPRELGSPTRRTRHERAMALTERLEREQKPDVD